MRDDPSSAIRSLPLDAWHRAWGARMVEFAGYRMPIHYEGIVAEHLWTREHAGLFDVSHMGQIALRGTGLDAALEALLPADLRALGPGRLRYSLLLDEAGGILDDLIVARWPEAVYMVVNGATKHADLAHIRAHLPAGVALDHLEDRALLALQGPAAAAVLARFARGVRGLGFMEGGFFSIGGVPAWISRSGYTGEDGFEISLPADHAQRVATWLACEAEVKPIGLGARDSLRLEAGLPLYGHDLSPATTPLMAGLGFALSKRRRAEGSYIGAGRIAQELAHGSPLIRVGLLVEGRQPVREGAAVVDAGGKGVGHVTSGGFSPTLQAPIAMAYVPAGMAAPGMSLTLVQRGKAHGAKVVPLPFVPHRYVRQGE